MLFPIKLPEELLGIYATLDLVAQHIKKDEMMELAMKLKKLRSDALKRSLSWRASGPSYANNCVVCKGSGQAHFCIDPFCDPSSELSKDDCLHFTPHELEIYAGIHLEYVQILTEVNELVRTGVSPEYLLKMGKPKTAHDMN